MILSVTSFSYALICIWKFPIPSKSPSKCRNHGQSILCFRKYFVFTLWSCVQSLWAFPVISDQYIIRLDQEFRTFERNSGMVLDWNRNKEWIVMMRLTWEVHNYCCSRICFWLWIFMESQWTIPKMFVLFLFLFEWKWHPTLQPFFAYSRIN